MKIYEFGEFRLSDGERKLSKSTGEAVPLTPNTFDLLALFLESGSRILSKDEILTTIWPDSIVDEANLTQAIYVLRKALGDSSREARFIRTVPSKGYRFVCDVKITDTTEHRTEADEMDAPAAENNDEPVTEDHNKQYVASTPRKRRYRLLIFGAICLALMAVAWHVAMDMQRSGRVYQQLTFERGTIWTARFVGNGPGVVYSASLNGRVLDLFTLALPSTGARRLNMPNTSLLSVSNKGELAVLLNNKYIYQFIHRGKLARVPLDGTVYREIADDVQEADWGPDAENLAIVRWTEGGNRLEYPIGNVLAETDGYFSDPRISANGAQIAYFAHESKRDNRGRVAVIDTDGRPLTSSDEWSGLEGLAWHGKEVWFTASRNGEAYALYAMAMNGGIRNVESAPMNLMLNDVSLTGGVLLSRAVQQTDVYLNRASGPDADLSWLQLIGIADLTQDGSAFLFTHFGEGSGTNYTTYLRKTDGSAAIRLGEGRALALSPDGKAALVKINAPQGLAILPTGTGDKRALPVGDIEQFERGAWLPDGTAIIFTGNEKGRPTRSYSQNLSDGSVKPVTPEGIFGTLVSPDGKTLVVSDAQGRKSIFNIGREEQSPISGLEDGDEVIRWDTSGRSLFVYKPLELPIRITRLDPVSGHRELVKEIQPSYTNGIFGDIYLFVTPDGKTAIYGLRRYLIDLYLVNGLE